MNASATWPQSIPLAAACTTQGSSVLRLASTHTLCALCISVCRMGARPLAFRLLRCFKHKELRENASWRNWKRCLSTYLTGINAIDLGASLVTQTVKNPPAMQETWVQSLGWEGPLEKGMATHSSILAWRIPWTEEPGRLQTVRLQRVGHD